jgi:hypothetical protein
MDFIYHEPIIPSIQPALVLEGPLLFADAIVPLPVEPQVQSHDVIEAIRLMILCSRDPYPQPIGLRRQTVTLPISLAGFHALLPGAIQCQTRRSTVARRARRLTSTPLWRQRFRNPRSLDHLFGPFWFTTHHQDKVGVFRDLAFVLRRKELTQWQTTDEDDLLVPGSFAKSSSLFLHVTFSFTHFKRASAINAEGVERSWEQQVEDLIEA